MKNTKYLLILLLVCCAGCASIGVKNTVLTSKDQMWTIPAGTKFTAIQLPDVKAPTEFTAAEDLSVLYKGNLLELEQEANRQAVKKAKAAKTTGLLLGGVGSVLMILAGLLGKSFLNKLSQGNDKKKKKK